MKGLRIIMVVLTVGLMSLATGHIGCGGGAIPFGGDAGKVLEELGVTTAPPEGGGPVAPVIKPGDVAVPIVTEKKETPPAERPGIPCLMNYALMLNPEYVLVIKSNEAILSVMGLIDFQLFSLVLDDPSIVDDLLAYADELVVAGGSQGTVALVRIKGELIESGKGEQDFEGLLSKLKLVISAALNRRATETGIPIPENDTVIYSSFTNDASAYVVGLSSTLAKLVNQTADVECNYCTIGACGTQNIPMLYLSMQGSAFYTWLQEMFPSKKTVTKTDQKELVAEKESLEQPFGAARFVMGLDIDTAKAATAYAALFDSTECTQESLLAAVSAYLNVTKGFGQRLLNAILAGVLESSKTPEVSEAGPLDLAGQIAQLEAQIADLEAQLQQALDAHNLTRVQQIQAEIDALKDQINDLRAQMGLPPLGQEESVETGEPSSAPTPEDAALLISLCDQYNSETDLNKKKLILQSIFDIEEKYGLHNTCDTSGVETGPTTAIPQTRGDTSGTFGGTQNIQMDRLRTLTPLIRSGNSGSGDGSSSDSGVITLVPRR